MDVSRPSPEASAPAPRPEDSPRRLKILHLEDSPADALLVEEALRNERVDCDLVVVSEAADFDRELAKGGVDVVLSDYSLPRDCGTDALQRTRKTERDLPFIFVSGSIGEERAAEAVRLGATDYVMKEHLRRLGIAVRRAVEAAESTRRRREAEARLAEERDFLVDVFSSVQDGLAVLDADLKIVRTNPAMEKLFPDRMPLVGQPHRIFYPDGAGDPGASALRDGQPSQRVCKLETARGPREFSIYSSPLLARQTAAQTGVILYVRDITDERAIQQQLFQSQKMESIGQLAGGVAHDFNNILQAIAGFSDLLASEIPAGDPAREDVLEIRKATERAIALTRQLLAFSRKQVLTIEDLDLGELVDRMGGMLRRIIGENIQLRCAVDSAPLLVHGDSSQIEQILLNLVVNARDAMPAGGEIAIAACARDVGAGEAAKRGPPWRAGRFVQLSVKDGGIGISPDLLPHLFEPFFTTKPKGKGTGLGLSTVYGIVHQHGGWLVVASQKDQGSTFDVYLPASKLESTEGTPA